MKRRDASVPKANGNQVNELDLELRLGYLIHDVSRLRRTLYDKWLSPLGITRSQWWVLAFLSRRDGMPQTDLAAELEVGKVALGALIDRLEDAGFVKRTLDGGDRRIKRVVLTPKGIGIVATLRKVSADFNKRILRGIPRDRLETMTVALHAMKQNLIDGGKEFAADGERADDQAPRKTRTPRVPNVQPQAKPSKRRPRRAAA